MGIKVYVKNVIQYTEKKHYKKNKEKIINQVNAYRKNHPEKYVNTNINKKAGRKFERKCSNPNCNTIVYVTKKDINDNKLRFCSKECRFFDKSPIKAYFHDVIKRAKLKKFKIDIDLEYLKDLLENKQKNRCAVTNIPISFEGETKIYKTPSLDRIDNNKGYVKGNVHWVILGINYMKLNHNINDLIMTLNLIKEHY